MSPETKTKLTYIILGTVYFAGGVENGVSVPRGWLHWHDLETTPNHVVGLVVAAYSVAAFFVAPLTGRWVDKPGRSKALILTGTCLHLLGALLEFFCTHNWVNIIARFISGLGGGMDPVVLSETSRYTPLARRAATMALLIGARFLGYMIVLGSEALLWKVALRYQQLNEYNTAVSRVPLMILWFVVLLLTVLFYTELCCLQPLPQRYSSFQNSSNPQIKAHFSGASGAKDYQATGKRTSHPVSISSSLVSSQASEDVPESLLGRSSEIIEEAEQYIKRMAEQSCTSSDISERFGFDASCVKHFEQSQLCDKKEGISDEMSTSFNHDKCERRKDSDLKITTEAWEEADVLVSSGTIDQNSYIQRYSSPPHYLQEQDSIFYTMFEDFIRHDIIALLTLVMSGTFSHLCFQMMIPPVMESFLDRNELYVAIVFSEAIVMLLLVCALMWWSNPKQKIAYVMLVGNFVLIIGSILFMMSLLNIKTENDVKKIILVCVSTALNVVGVLLSFICVATIFTRICSPQHHGLSQGVYHSVISVSAILAPLWIEGTFTLPYLHHGVIISLLVTSLILLFCSIKRLTSFHYSTRKRFSRQHSAQNRLASSKQDQENKPLLF